MRTVLIIYKYQLAALTYLNFEIVISRVLKALQNTGTEVPGGNCRQRRNNKAQQKTCKIGILKVYDVILKFCCCTQHSFSEDVVCSNKTLELHYKPLIYLFCIFFAGLYSSPSESTSFCYIVM